MTPEQLQTKTPEEINASFGEQPTQLASKKYWQPQDGSMSGMFTRVSGFAAGAERDAERRRIYEGVFYRLMSQKYFCPGGRILAGASTGHGNVLNCLSGDTRTYTLEHGLVRLGDVVGRDVTVLSLDGDYQPAKIESFGEQQLYTITFSNGQKVRATAEHRWLVTPRDNHGDPVSRYRKVKTLELVGKRVPIAVTERRPETNDDFRSGFQHGAVFGDGYLSHERKKTGDYLYEVRMFGDSVSIANMFDDVREASYCDGRAIVVTDKLLKELPDEGESDSYWYGFFCGWLATDGNCSTDGSVIIHNKDKSVLETIASQLPRFGVIHSTIRETRSISPFDGTYKPVFGMRIMKYSLQEQDFYRETSYQNFVDSGTPMRRPSLSVVSVEPDSVEEVYCAVVPENEIFNVEGLLTQNCFRQDGTFETGEVEHPEFAELDNDTWAMNIARKLALVTAGGGGNGVNLDRFPDKSPDAPKVGRVTIYIDNQHKDTPNVLAGRMFDTSRGEYVTRPYRYADVTDATWPNSLVDDVIMVGDSIDEIWRAAAAMVKRMDEGRNVIIDLSQLRPEGSPISGSAGTSSGAASFALEVFDNFAYWKFLGGGDYAGPVATLRYIFAPTLRVVKQGGQRRGAGMATLSAHSSDIEDFITCKSLEREQDEGDISTFNISVVKGKDTPPDIMRMIAEQAHATGEPGLLFRESINKNNSMRDALGDIDCTNPCGEIPLYPGEPCDLAAMNLPNYVVQEEGFKPYFDYKLFELHVPFVIRFLDNILDVNKFAIQSNEDMSRHLRRLGLGVMGLGDALIMLGVRYGSDEGNRVTESIFATLRDAAYKASVYLAKERGAFPGIEESRGIKEPRRNVAGLTVAPTGTTSMLFETSSGIEPNFAPLIFRRIDTEYVTLLSPLFKEMLDKYPVVEGYGTRKHKRGEGWTTEWNYEKVAAAISAGHGSLAGLAFLPEPIRHLFACAHDVTPEEHVNVQGLIQRTLDGDGNKFANSLSKTINLPEDATVESVMRAYELAEELGCKGITVYRDGSRQFQVLNTSPQESGEEEEEVEGEAEEEVNQPEPATTPSEVFREVLRDRFMEDIGKPRPTRLRGFTDKVKVTDRNGKQHSYFLTVNSSEASGEPYEVFLVAGKAGDETNADSEALGRLASVALQFGVPAQAVIDTLRGIDGGLWGSYEGRIVASKADLLAVALDTSQEKVQATREKGQLEEGFVRKAVAPTGVSCPECGSSEVEVQGGCMTCKVCGNSKCG